MDELTSAQEESLIGALKALKVELVQTLKLSTEGAKPVDLGEAMGRISRGDAMQAQKMVAANRQSHIRRLQQVDAALKRAAEGDYGLCVACEEAIGHGRLTARPETPLCLACQSKSEGGRRR